MKTLLLLTTLFIVTGFSQPDETIKELSRAKWKTETERLTFGSKVLRMEGDNKQLYYVTNIAYQSLNHLLDETRSDHKKQMKPVEETATTIKAFEMRCAGGLIWLYLERISIGWANTDNFTAIIQDSIGNEVFRQTLKSNVADVPNRERGKTWNNFTTIPIDTPLTKPFTIYIIDGLASGDKPTRYVFQVVN
jgi:hypothetical protein